MPDVGPSSTFGEQRRVIVLIFATLAIFLVSPPWWLITETSRNGPAAQDSVASAGDPSAPHRQVPVEPARRKSRRNHVS
jgi:hypothetical protein